MAAPERSDDPTESRAETIPVLEEKATLTTREVSKGGVRVTTRTDHVEEAIAVSLASEGVEIIRVPIGSEVSERPGVREAGDTIIVPVLEEVIVTQKKLVLKEELHIKRHRTVRQTEIPITRLVQTAVVERMEGDADRDQ